MSSRFRVASFTVAALLAVPVVSACDTSPGAAALVGSQSISNSRLQSEVSHALADHNVSQTVFAGISPTATDPATAAKRDAARQGFVRQTLSRLVGDQLVIDLAAAHHVTATPQEVTAEQQSFVQQAGSIAALQQQAAQAVGVGASGLGPLLRITLLQQKLETALAAEQPATQAQLQAEYNKDIDQYDQLDVAQIAVTKQALAQRLLRQVRAKPASFAALAARYSVDPASKASGGHIGLVPRSQVIGVLPKGSSAKPGTFAVIHSGSQWVVLHIISRQLTPLSQVVDKLKAAIYGTQGGPLLGKALQAEAVKVGVHVNPRYGHWDNTSQSVVATKSPVSSTG